jgi:hypothetical protein
MDSWYLFSNSASLQGGHKILSLAFLVALAACVQQPRDQGYARSILDRPLPVGKSGINRECDFLFHEIARQEEMAQALPSVDLLPETALAIQKATQTNIAALELRVKQSACVPSSEAIGPTDTETLPFER